MEAETLSSVKHKSQRRWPRKPFGLAGHLMHVRWCHTLYSLKEASSKVRCNPFAQSPMTVPSQWGSLGHLGFIHSFICHTCMYPQGTGNMEIQSVLSVAWFLIQTFATFCCVALGCCISAPGFQLPVYKPEITKTKWVN